MGLFKIGSFIRFIPVSIVIGFTNGIAVLIGLSQIKDFLGLNIAKMPADFFHQIETLAGAINTVNPYAVGLGLASLIIVFVWLVPGQSAVHPGEGGLPEFRVPLSC